MMIVYLLYFCFFFFQAEDGIRDLTVTGVQTCALPILIHLVGEEADADDEEAEDGQRDQHLDERESTLAPHHRFDPPVSRSEERRVGKECRSRWWTYH